jgi:hypothetical protein
VRPEARDMGSGIGAEAFKGGRWPGAEWPRVHSDQHLLAHYEFFTTVLSVPATLCGIFMSGKCHSRLKRRKI